MSRQANRRWDERLALEVIKRVEQLKEGDWEWLRPSSSPTPDLRLRRPSAEVEITSYVASDQKQFWKAMRFFRAPQPISSLKYDWKLLIAQGPIRIKDSLKRLKLLLGEIETTEGSPSDLRQEAQRRFDPRPYLDKRYLLNRWCLEEESGRPPLGQWLKSRIDYWYPQEIVRAWQGGDYPSQTVFAHWDPVSGGGGIRCLVRSS